MSYNKSNAAYDLSTFLPVEQDDIDEKKRNSPDPKKTKKPKQSVKPSVVVKWVFVSLFVLISLASIMVGNIKITQLSDQISVAQKNLSMSQSEQISLNSKLESRMSMQAVEDYAVNKLGLIKVQPYQIQYVQLTDKDKVVLSSDNFGLFGFVKNVINSVVEYFT